MSQARTVAGVPVYIEGDGAETIVMIHGWPDTYRLWDRQVEALKSSYRCVRFTLPGFERSDERRRHSLDEVIALIKQVVDQVAPGREVILMLHDWGCIFGYEFYMRHPGRVSRIIGVDIGDVGALRKELTPKGMARVLGYQLWLAFAWMIGGSIGDRMTRFMARLLRCPTDPESIHSGMTYPYFIQWFGGRQSYRRRLQRFFPGCAMLYVYGARKPLMFHTQGFLNDLQEFPGNRVAPFNTGHWVMIDQPEAFNALVREWLSPAHPVTAAVA